MEKPLKMSSKVYKAWYLVQIFQIHLTGTEPMSFTLPEHLI